MTNGTSNFVISIRHPKFTGPLPLLRQSAKRSAADPAWSVTSVASGPWETDGWVCDLGARMAQPGRGGSAPARRTAADIASWFDDLIVGWAARVARAATITW